MPNPFESGKKQVWSPTPETIYRYTPEPIPNLPLRNEYRDFFWAHQPGDWMYTSYTVQKFRELYGDEAVKTLEDFGVVPENVDAVWVGGPINTAGVRTIRPVYGGREQSATDKKIATIEQRVGALEKQVFSS